MELEILTPERRIFTGEVYGVQLPGIIGSFEVLGNHAPMVSGLTGGKLKILKDSKNDFVFFNISGGFVEVLNNKTTVLAESATEL